MNKNWEIKRLGEVCDFQNGFAFKSKTFKESGIPVVRITNIQNEKLDLSKIVYIDPSDYNKDLRRYEIKKDDLLIAMSDATTGKIGIHTTDEKLLLNQRVGKFEPKPVLDKTFLFNFLITKVEESLAISAGAAQPNLSTLQIKNFQIPIPPLPEQKRIVTILDKAFSAIDKAKQNALGNLKNAKEVFESYLQNVFENKGDDWVEKKLGEVCVVERGSSPRPIKKYITESIDGVNWIKIGDTKGIEKYLYKTKQKITKEGSKKSRYVNIGDFILSNSMSYGKPYIMKTDGYIHDGWFVLRLPNDIYTEFFWYLLSSPYTMKQFSTLASGAIVKNISGDLVKKTILPIPPLSEQKQIVQKLDALSAETKKLEGIYQQKFDDLQELKKSILQKSFNGEL